jgi:hypothetical protein
MAMDTGTTARTAQPCEEVGGPDEEQGGVQQGADALYAGAPVFV